MNKAQVALVLGLVGAAWQAGGDASLSFEGVALAQQPPQPILSAQPAPPGIPPVPQPYPALPATQPMPPPTSPLPDGAQPVGPWGPQPMPPPPMVYDNSRPPQPYPGFRPQPFLPKEMDFIPGAPIPPGYRQDTEIRKGLAIAGWTTLGTLYLTSIITAGLIIDSNHESGAGALFVPAIGPFISLGTTGPGVTAGTFLVLDGLGQTAGLVMGIAAIAAPKQVIVRTEYASLRFEPFTLRGGSTMTGLSGEF